MDHVKDVHSLFKMGGQPRTIFSSVTAEGSVTELLWLETEFTHCYGIDRLWLKNQWIEDPILLYICKQSGADADIFECIFYDPSDPYKDKSLWVTVEEALFLFVKMENWTRSRDYNELVTLMVNKTDTLYTHLLLDYIKEHQLQSDLNRLIEALGQLPSKNKLFIEISF